MNKLREEENEQRSQSERSPKRGFFSLLFSTEVLGWEKVAAIIPVLFFAVILALFYIGNRHIAEKNIREIERLNAQLKDLKTEYLNAKSELMYLNKLSEVAKRAENIGLKETIEPPQKLVIKTENEN